MREKKQEWERTELTASEISKGSNKPVWEYPSPLAEILESVWVRPEAYYNPVKSDQKHDQRRKQLLQTKQTNRKLCVWCNVNSHKSSKCEKVKGMRERKKHLSEKKLCFNYTENKQRASECKSKRSCQISQRKHHASMYDKNIQMMMTKESLVIHPVVVVKVNNIMCRALLNTGARSSNASAALLDWLKLKLIKKETKKCRNEDVLNNQ